MLWNTLYLKMIYSILPRYIIYFFKLGQELVTSLNQTWPESSPDLLESWKTVTKKNEDISLLYIAYQTAMMVSSILTPGTIFMLVVGAITSAYPEIPLFGSLILNLIPVGIFLLLVFTAKSNTQVRMSLRLSYWDISE